MRTNVFEASFLFLKSANSRKDCTLNCLFYINSTINWWDTTLKAKQHFFFPHPADLCGKMNTNKKTHYFSINELSQVFSKLWRCPTLSWEHSPLGNSTLVILEGGDEPALFLATTLITQSLIPSFISVLFEGSNTTLRSSSVSSR